MTDREADERQRLPMNVPRYHGTDPNFHPSQNTIPPAHEKDHKDSCWKVSICCSKCIWFIFFSLYGIGHAVASVFSWVVVHECRTNTTDLMKDTYYQFTATLYAFTAVLHAYVAWLIVVRLCRLEWKEFCESIRNKNYYRICFFLLGAIPPILLIIIITIIGLESDFKKTHCKHTHKYIASNVSYHILLLIVTLIAAIALGCLMRTTMDIRDIWKFKKIEHPKPCNNVSELTKSAQLDYADRCIEYDSRGRKVMLLTQPYKSWFVVHWTIYFLGIFIDLTYVLRPWILGGERGLPIYRHQKWDYAYVGVFILFDFVVFLIPYGCGLMMNHYHTQYYKELTNNEIELEAADNDNKILYALISKHYKVDKNEDYDFTPSIFFIDIPLQSPGYTITIFITMVTLILSFLVQPLQLN